MSAMIVGTWAKNTYIPTYRNRLVMIEDGEVDSLINQAHSLTLLSKDGLVACTLEQQIVSEDLVRSIKRAKSSAGWAMVAAAISSASEGVAQSQMNNTRNVSWAVNNYVYAHENKKASLAAANELRKDAENLKTLVAELVVKNNSAKEMLISDIDRGLVWFVLPDCEVRLSIAKDEDCHFRISSCNPLDENVKYINVCGTNTLEKYAVALETDLSWYIPLSRKTVKRLNFETDKKFGGYIKIDKETMRMSYISDADFLFVKKGGKIDDVYE